MKQGDFSWSRRVFGLGALAAGALGLAGCAAPKVGYYDLWNVRDAFSKDGQALFTGEGISGAATKMALYPVSFEDAFHVADVAASQAQMEVEITDKSAGVIYATRTAMVPQGTGTIEQRTFYAITIQEQGKKKTQVRISAKVQRPCVARATTPGGRLVNGVFTLGTSEVMVAMGEFHTDMDEEKKKCEAIYIPHWTAGSGEEMSQFFIFMRNNLQAAGLM
jgi:hypothetical protein